MRLIVRRRAQGRRYRPARTPRYADDRAEREARRCWTHRRRPHHRAGTVRGVRRHASPTATLVHCDCRLVRLDSTTHPDFGCVHFRDREETP